MIVAAPKRSLDSSRFAGAARFWKDVCASITRPCGLAKLFFPSGTHTTSTRSSIAAISVSCASWPACRFNCATAVNSKNLPATVAPISSFSSCLTNCCANRSRPSAGACSSHMRARSSCSANLPGMTARKSFGCEFCKKLRRREHANLIEDWVSFRHPYVPHNCTATTRTLERGPDLLDESAILFYIIAADDFDSRPLVRSRLSVRLPGRSVCVTAFCQTQKNPDQVVRGSLLLEFSISR